ncbi:ABC transporter permease [Lachnobacterium bovis]|uniref:ABC transporter permease n=1 Tax=Lachnobacterium bovis TaxID=140626 RepID=UPI0004916BD3|nr:ABC transporter permease subunit [Lachnobacterium bovis]
MNKLIKYELKKTFTSKAIYVCGGIGVLVAILNGFLSCTKGHVTGKSYLIGLLPGSLLSTLIAILVPIIVCEEMESGCIKTMIGKGYSRNKIFFSKVIVSNLYMILLASVSLFTGLVYAAFSKTNFNGITSKYILNVILEMLVFMIIVNLGILFSVLAKIKGIAIAATIFCPSVIEIGLLALDVVTKKEIMSKFWYGSFNPALMEGVLKNSEYIRITLVSLSYNLIFLGIAYVLLRKKDF